MVLPLNSCDEFRRSHSYLRQLPPSSLGKLNMYKLIFIYLYSLKCAYRSTDILANNLTLSHLSPSCKSLPQGWLSPGWQWVIFGSWSEWVEEQGPVGYTKVPVAPLMYPKTYTGVLLWGISSHLSQQTALWEFQVASPLFCRGTSAALHTPC